MFTGIIEVMATVLTIDQIGTNVELWFESSITDELKIDHYPVKTQTPQILSCSTTHVPEYFPPVRFVSMIL